MIYRSSYVKAIMAYTDTPFVKILTGIRRCGKSTILKMIMEELRQRGIPEDRIISYRFDSMEYEDMTASDVKQQIEFMEMLKNMGGDNNSEDVDIEDIEAETTEDEE